LNPNSPYRTDSAVSKFVQLWDTPDVKSTEDIIQEIGELLSAMSDRLTEEQARAYQQVFAGVKRTTTIEDKIALKKNLAQHYYLLINQEKILE
jgi:hypothetical protein